MISSMFGAHPEGLLNSTVLFPVLRFTGTMIFCGVVQLLLLRPVKFSVLGAPFTLSVAGLRASRHHLFTSHQKKVVPRRVRLRGARWLWWKE